MNNSPRAERSSQAFASFMRELQANDPAVGQEISDALTQNEGFEAANEVDLAALETIVLTQGRPVLDIKQNSVVIEIAEVQSQIWKERLTNATQQIAPNIPAVGRIELSNHPRGVQWLGTGWLVSDDIVVTNRHVAEIFGALGSAGFVFRPGFDESPMRSSIDFVEEFGRDEKREFPLFKIIHIEPGSGPDLAFLRVEPVAGQALPTPAILSTTAAQLGEEVALIAYPARDDFFPDPAVMDRIFNNRYDKKRLAPGLVIGASAERLFHDCSSLGGASGGELVSLKTGHAVALHFAGTLFAKNHAVPAEIVGSRLSDVIAGRTRAPQRASTTPSAEAPQLQATTPRPLMKPRVVEATIPIKVRIEIGDLVDSAASSVRTVGMAPQHEEPGDDIEVVEARAEDYRDRDGYNPKFLGAENDVPLPKLTKNLDDVLQFLFNGETRELLDYEHFSVLMSANRRMCRFSACNIDGKSSKKKKRKGWKTDPRIPADAQIIKECYGNAPKFSRGHMTRREDPVWGSDDSASLGNADSMHATNAVPQVQTFNAGIWLSLEDYALDHTREDDMRICVFTGPFLANNDPIRFGVKIPISFWKVIAFIHDETEELCATGYTMSQKSFLSEEEFVFGEHENRQRPIAEIEARAGISFGPLTALDPLADAEEAVSEVLIDPSQIRFLRRKL